MPVVAGIRGNGFRPVHTRDVTDQPNLQIFEPAGLYAHEAVYKCRQCMVRQDGLNGRRQFFKHALQEQAASFGLRLIVDCVRSGVMR